MKLVECTFSLKIGDQGPAQRSAVPGFIRGLGVRGPFFESGVLFFRYVLIQRVKVFCRYKNTLTVDSFSTYYQN